MKRISNIYKTLLTALAVLCLTTSCTDYLTIVPPDKITEEHYWQTEDDVNGILAKAYLELLSSDAIRKAIVWGELRSETLTFPASNIQDLKYIVEANILDENSYCDWAVYYRAIQTANLVIDRAPQVVDRDPDFNEGDLDVVLGEMYALRALAHFYLVRTFRDIPMALEVVADDYEMPEYYQVKPLEALNYIMADLDKAQGLVMKSGNYPTIEKNFGRITENAVLAIKADVNLWRAAFATYYEGTTELVAEGDIERYYNECIENCKDVIANIDSWLEEKSEGKPGPKYPYNLLQNEGELKVKEEHMSTVYVSIFGVKNSDESIFELQVEGTNVTNGFARGVCEMYGTEGKNPALIVPKNFAKENYEKDDLRAYSYMNITSLSGNNQPNDGSEPTDIHVAKYSAAGSPAVGYRKESDYDANWIVYRKTDVLLMMAEALALRPSSDVEDFKEAFRIVNAINTRSRIDSTNIEHPLIESNYINSRVAISELVLKERLLELSFEGKRWFDLVRKALREKSTTGIKFVADKLDSNSDVVKSKLSTIDGLFMPIHIDELRYNKLLEQNPAYNKEDSSTEMN